MLIDKDNVKQVLLDFADEADKQNKWLVVGHNWLTPDYIREIVALTTDKDIGDLIALIQQNIRYESPRPRLRELQAIMEHYESLASMARTAVNSFTTTYEAWKKVQDAELRDDTNTAKSE